MPGTHCWKHFASCFDCMIDIIETMARIRSCPSSRLGTHRLEARLPGHVKRSFENGVPKPEQAGAWEPDGNQD
jgi:hypothetical protein